MGGQTLPIFKKIIISFKQNRISIVYLLVR